MKFRELEELIARLQTRQASIARLGKGLPPWLQPVAASKVREFDVAIAHVRESEIADHIVNVRHHADSLLEETKDDDSRWLTRPKNDHMSDGADIETLKKAIKDYVRSGYASGTTLHFVRDVLTVMREMPEFQGVKADLNAGVERLIGY